MAQLRTAFHPTLPRQLSHQRRKIRLLRLEAREQRELVPRPIKVLTRPADLVIHIAFEVVGEEADAVLGVLRVG